uniref:CCHC-type domain-containing protein n=1 Tax=Terrapene triunguis TaxID=2587831 RepID=A0A674J719_9SAUR
MLQEWAVPDAEKRRRLVECLRGPALDVIRTLKLKVREEEERQAAGEVWEVQPHQATGTTSIRTPKALMVNPQEELTQRVQVLTQKVAELENTIDSANTSRYKEPSATTVQKTTFRTSAPLRQQGKGQSFFCYRCGQGGHIAARCQNAENPTLVYQKLRTTWGKSGNGPRAWEGSRHKKSDA